MQNSWQQLKCRSWELGHWVQLLKTVPSAGVVKAATGTFATEARARRFCCSSTTPSTHYFIYPPVKTLTCQQSSLERDSPDFQAVKLRAQGRHDSGKQLGAESASLCNAHPEECRRRNMKPLVWQEE